jgi:hypothetical protein
MNEIEELLEIARILVAAEPFDLKSKYRYWNARAFGGELPNLPLVWTRSRRLGGYVKALVKYDNMLQKRMGEGNITLKKLAISNFLQMSEERFDEIMLHEMIHVYVMGVLGKTESHGYEFLRKRREVQSKTGIKIPITEDISGMEIAEDVPDREVGVLLAKKKDGKTMMQVFGLRAFNRLYRNIIDEMKRKEYWYPWFALVESKERELQKYPEQRKYRRGWYLVQDSFAKDILQEGRVLAEVAV